jgi:hypothetical protein
MGVQPCNSEVDNDHLTVAGLNSHEDQALSLLHTHLTFSALACILLGEGAAADHVGSGPA